MKKITLKKTPLTLITSDEARFKIDYKRELNDAQYQAVAKTEGPMLVIAGAGTEIADEFSLHHSHFFPTVAVEFFT